MMEEMKLKYESELVDLGEKHTANMFTQKEESEQMLSDKCVEYETKISELINEYEQKLAQAQADFDAMKNDLEKQLQDLKDSLTGDAADRENRLKDEIVTLKATITERDSEIDGLKQNNSDQADEITKLKEEIVTLQSRISELESELEKVKSDLSHALDASQSNMGDLLKQIEDLKLQVESARENGIRLVQETKEMMAREKKEEMEKQKDKYETIIASLRKEMEMNANNAEGEFQTRIQNLQAQVEEL